MAQVNLLPWRETEQQRTKQRFYRHIAAVIGVTTAVILVAYFSISALQQQQGHRNRYLQQQISLLDNQLAELTEITEQHDQVSNRIKLIHQLHHDGTTAIAIFNELAARTPGGIVLISVDKKDRVLTLHGQSAANHQVAEFLRLLNASPQFEQADIRQLVSTETDDVEGDVASTFTVIVGISQGPSL
jgi:type IV pilus assembly protein PilN